VRLGQAHGAGPFTGDQFAQVGVLLLGGAVLGNGVHRAMGQAWVHAPGPVGFTDHLADRQAQRLRQALAAVSNIMGQARPAAFDELFVGFLEASRGLHTRLAPLAAFEVANAVQRRQHVLAELGTFLKDRIDHIGRGFLATRQALVVRFIAEQFVANEANITQRGFVFRHCDEPLEESGGVSADSNRHSVKQLFETYV